MIPTDAELSILELDTYAVTPKGDVIASGDDRVVVATLPGCRVVSIMGTTTPAQWLSNFKVCGVSAAAHPLLGICESGFLAGALALWPLLQPVVSQTTDQVVLQGHSRGAGMVPILAGMMLDAGLKPARCVAWESPWAVGEQCRRLLLDASIVGMQYWHGDDPIPCVPAVPWLVPHVWPVTHFGAWQLDAFSCHSMAGIVATMHAPVIALGSA